MAADERRKRGRSRVTRSGQSPPCLQFPPFQFPPTLTGVAEGNTPFVRGEMDVATISYASRLGQTIRFVS
jgi:hypothetical protein